jgi:hypothetical protein
VRCPRARFSAAEVKARVWMLWLLLYLAANLVWAVLRARIVE